MTYGVKNKMWHGLKDECLKKVAHKILKGCFKFKHVRRVEILMPNKRFLVTGNFRDRVVQQAIRMVLEQIFEPRFLSTSHGFRARKGCHSVFKQIQFKWLNTS
jgi:retron-type reverse transcriptase